jgi:hypothetical protein
MDDEVVMRQAMVASSRDRTTACETKRTAAAQSWLGVRRHSQHLNLVSRSPSIQERSDSDGLSSSVSRLSGTALDSHSSLPSFTFRRNVQIVFRTDASVVLRLTLSRRRAIADKC